MRSYRWPERLILALVAAIIVFTAPVRLILAVATFVVVWFFLEWREERIRGPR